MVSAVLRRGTYSFAKFLDAAYLIMHDIEKIIERSIPSIKLTDSKILLRTIFGSASTDEKILICDLPAAREAYEGRDISSTGWIRSKLPSGDGKTKLSSCEGLDDVIQTERLYTKIEQWIECATVRRQHCDQAIYELFGHQRRNFAGKWKEQSCSSRSSIDYRQLR